MPIIFAEPHTFSVAAEVEAAVRLFPGNHASLAYDAVENIHANTEGDTESRIPSDGAADGINNGNARYRDLGKLKRKVLSRYLHLRLSREDSEYRKFSCQHKS